MNLSPSPLQKFFGNNGEPLVGGLLFTYTAGTSTKVATYTDASGATSNTNPIVLNYRGEANVWLDPTLTYKFVLSPPGDTDPPTKPIWTVDNISAAIAFADLTRQFIGRIFYPASAEELSAGAPIFNYYYPYGHWDRYGNNSVPGTTDMSTAASMAYKVAALTRCSVRYGATAPYRLNNPVNCTAMRGIVTWDESSKNASAGQPSVIIGHTGHGFDLTGSTNMVFRDMVASNFSGITPKTLFFCARIVIATVATGAGQHRFHNISTPSGCTFTNIFYWYASEENVISDSELYNSAPGSSNVNINCTNPSGYTSTFQPTMATGAQSNARHVICNTNILNIGNSGGANEVCLAIERANNVSWTHGLAYCKFGLAYLTVGGTVGSTFLTVFDIRGETDGGATTTCGIAVRTSAATGADRHLNWSIRQFGFHTGGAGYLLDCNATSDIKHMEISICNANSGNLALFHDITYGNIEHGEQVVVATSANTATFVGLRANVTITTATNVTYIDQANGVFGGNGVRFPAVQAPSADVNTLDDYEEGTWTPALVMGAGNVTAYGTQTGTYTKVGRMVTVMAFIAVSTVGGGPAGTLKISGLPFASSANLKGAVSVAVNTFGGGAAPVMGFVDAAASTISLFVLAGGALGNAGGNIAAGTQVFLTTSYEV